ncbi:MAG TPA: alkaline phosphatase family protein [Candidatus Acidoferrales bacterium]|nr:alkaline phosphatase family protein [Candidatus Acidoferrales bacterium]
MAVWMFPVRRLPLILALSFLLLAAPTSAQDAAQSTSPERAGAGHARGRIVVLMVWDGLRPDMVTQRDTPNLFRMAREGVRFDRHHSVFPTLTMVNGAALATGAPSGVNGLDGNLFYLQPGDFPGAPPIETSATSSTPASTIAKDNSNNPSDNSNNPMASAPTDQPPASADDSKKQGRLVWAEDAKAIVNLNGADGFKGRLFGLDTISQEVAREGGYIAVVGKQGPTAIFDNRVTTVADGKDLLGEPHRDYLFASDDLVLPLAAAEKIKAAMPAEGKSGVYAAERDLYFARLTVENALPAAKLAAESGRPALVVLWQHNPDLTQHMAGLGTMPAIEALGLCDNNLMRVRAAIDSLGIGDRTDLIVVSDHGFATIKLRVVLSDMLVSVGLKKSHDSTDIIVAPNGGADLIYLSPTEFPTPESRRLILQKIVDFAEAQEWCGPIFSREAATPAADTVRHGRVRRAPKPKAYLGWIEGTFSQRIVGLYSESRSPDLVVSFREVPDADNRNLTGPANPAFLIAGAGQSSTKNKSAPLVHPVKGLVYSDSGPRDTFTTGMGMHGAAGEREIHNFCAAVGPDFRRGFVDLNPTANTDVAPTITQILGTLPNIGPRGVAPTGRAMTEALADGRHSAGGAHAQAMTASLELQGVEAITTLHVTWIGDEPYLDGSTVERKPLGSSP